jgi:SNF2 family DNA or RNA helicase
MVLPRSLEEYALQAKQYLDAGAVADVEFSGGTYQVLVHIPVQAQSEWTFLQLDDRGRLRDSFCPCPEGEEKQVCIHQAVALLYLYGKHTVPLHQRFARSLWNCLCEIYSAQFDGTTRDIETVKRGKYECHGEDGNLLVSIEGKNEAAISRLESIFFDRKRETEETSLKFSNLSPEEIQQWRQGKPTAQLRYELSFWSDLAKWLLIEQENSCSYVVSFNYAKNGLPNGVKVDFPNLKAEFYIAEGNLPQVIPSLAMVDTPLKVHNTPQEEIQQIVYDKNSRTFHIEQKDASIRGPKNDHVLVVGDWKFVSKDGFYPKNRHSLLVQKKIREEAIETLLTEHTELLKQLLVDCPVHDALMPTSYTMNFDSQWNLHISGYLFKPGDVNTGKSHCFGSWAYLDMDNKRRGFYHLDERYFPEMEKVIAAEEVADFVTENRIWLSSQPGMSTHIAALEAALTYHVTDQGALIFSKDSPTEHQTGESKDFGQWTYVVGEGFYSKPVVQTKSPIRNGVTIAREQLPFFVHANRNELYLMEGFFSPICPVDSVKVNVVVNDEGNVEVIPEYHLKKEYESCTVRFFEDISYVEKEGFHELPARLRLPERFRHAVTISHEQLPHFIAKDLPHLEDWINILDRRLKKSANFHLTADSIERIGGPHEGYSLKLNYESDQGILSVASIWQALKKQQRFLLSDAGLIDLSDQRFNWLKHLDKKKMNLRTEKNSLSTMELLKLNALEEISPSSKNALSSQKAVDLLQELTEFRLPEEPDLTGLKSNLRPYQQTGLRWLWFLYNHGLSGLLCDDMGLGKTHQAMALFIAIVNQQRKKLSVERKRFLVVCPTSVIYHWQEKLHEFLPELRLWTFHGSNRSLENSFEQCDILLTSYGIFRNEAKNLNAYEFEVAVFDEIQIAKNHTSLIHKRLSKIKARMRVGLSGTPLENRLRELKSLFDLVLPGYMFGDDEYREFFVRPIENLGDLKRKQLLSRLIRPFVLRRKKEDVLIELPEKTEEISHCDLAGEQYKLYTNVLMASREKILEDLQDKSVPVPYMHIFALLSHLKQICNHPASYLKTPLEFRKHHSGKWDLFVELLNEARESGQKVVVFSQYLSMLDIIENYLKEQGIGYAAIRGATAKRGEQLQRFKNDPGCEVFVASLQAAGLGVDLTAASVVIHYDRWWNAARENQATDRVHRIGQTRGVQVFKLMVKHTLEEHIDKMIQKKLRLMEDVVGVDDQLLIKQFERDEMIMLLKMLPTEKEHDTP